MSTVAQFASPFILATLVVLTVRQLKGLAQQTEMQRVATELDVEIRLLSTLDSLLREIAVPKPGATAVGATVWATSAQTLTPHSPEYEACASLLDILSTAKQARGLPGWSVGQAWDNYIDEVLKESPTTKAMLDATPQYWPSLSPAD